MSENNTTTATATAPATEAQKEAKFDLAIGPTKTWPVAAREVSKKGKKSSIISFTVNNFAEVGELLAALATVEGHNEETVTAWVKRELFAPLGREIGAVAMEAIEGIKVEVDEKGQPKIGADGKPVVMLDAEGKPVKETNYSFDPELASGAIGEELQPPSRRPGGGSEKELNTKFQEISAELVPLYREKIKLGATFPGDKVARMAQLDLELATIQEKLEKMATAKADRAAKKAENAKTKAAKAAK